MAWGIYKNGNAVTRINLENGTKIRETKDDFWNLEFPETIDVNIGNRCDGGCPFCYINATPNGANGELLDVPFIDTLHPYTEIAINGNSVDHPQLIPFLEKLRDKNVIANITVNQKHFEKKLSLLHELTDAGLVKGIGISLVDPTDKFIESVKKFPNAVIHTICGILIKEDIEKLSDFDLKILILGYKYLGRGVAYNTNNQQRVADNQTWLADHISELFDKFAVVAFDNLAIEQLNIKSVLSKEEWDRFYMGDEGTSSMYVDLVTRKFGISSLCSESEMMPIMDNVVDMFEVVKQKAKGGD